MGFSEASEQQSAWMNSPEHRKNILNANYQEIGVAVKNGMLEGQLTTLTVQEFGSRADFVPGNFTEKSIIGQNPGRIFGETVSQPVGENDVLGFKSSQFSDVAQSVLWSVIVLDALIALYLLADKMAVFFHHRPGTGLYGKMS
jgi:hypothetical protein